MFERFKCVFRNLNTRSFRVSQINFIPNICWIFRLGSFLRIVYFKNVQELLIVFKTFIYFFFTFWKSDKVTFFGLFKLFQIWVFLHFFFKLPTIIVILYLLYFLNTMYIYENSVFWNRLNMDLSFLIHIFVNI